MSLDTKPLAEVLDETATAYETVVALPAVVERVAAGCRASGKPGSAPPPGVGEMLDVDEYDRAVTGTDDWALFIAHILVDEVPRIGSVPHSTAGRLRLAARWADHMEGHPDAHLRYSIALDAREHLSALRRVSKRGTRVVETNSPCLDVSCPGDYTATISGIGATGELVCSGCAQRVPLEQWERWGARSKWVTPQRVANILGMHMSTVQVWAHRYAWDREVNGREVRYLTSDVHATVKARGLHGVALIEHLV